MKPNYTTIIIIKSLFQNCNTLCIITPNCTVSSDVCNLYGECCNLDHFKWEDPGIGRNLIFLVLVGVFLFIVLFLKEFGLLKSLYYKVFRSSDESALELIPKVALDSDVQAEKIKVRNMSTKDIAESNMVMMDMVKVYGKFPAVKGVSVAVKE